MPAESAFVGRLSNYHSCLNCDNGASSRGYIGESCRRKFDNNLHIQFHMLQYHQQSVKERRVFFKSKCLPFWSGVSSDIFGCYVLQYAQKVVVPVHSARLQVGTAIQYAKIARTITTKLMKPTVQVNHDTSSQFDMPTINIKCHALNNTKQLAP